MSYEYCDEHLQPLPRSIDDEHESDSSVDRDQLDIVSDREEHENLLVRLNNYLNLESADDTEVNANEDHEQNSEEKSTDEDEPEQGSVFDNPIVSNIQSSSTTPPIIIVDYVVHSPQPSSKVNGEPGSRKRKRRQLSIKEKFSALNGLEKNLGNKQLTTHLCIFQCRWKFSR